MRLAYIILAADDATAKETVAELWGEAAQLHGEQEEVWVARIVGHPLEELENFPEKMRAQNRQMGRIIAVVDVTMLEQRAELKGWWEMLTHFADVVLLKKTEQASPKWLTELKKGLKDRPVLTYAWPQALKKTPESVRAELLYPEARRLSQYWEEAGEAQEVEAELWAGDEENPTEVEETEEDDEARVVEKYFERDAAGRYKIKFQLP